MQRQQLLQRLIDLGWILVPLHGKAAFENDWSKLTVSHPPAAFEPSDNVGLILGNASCGIVDVDLDAMAAVRLAEFFLPPTNVIFGRESKPRSHWLYRVPSPGRTIQFCRRPKKGEIKKEGDEKNMIVELRGTGGYTMIPPASIQIAERRSRSRRKWRRRQKPIGTISIGACARSP